MITIKKKDDVLLVLGLQPTSSRETWNPTASLSHEAATEWTTPQVKKAIMFISIFLISNIFSYA
jgi:hypothetical protein